MNTLVNSIIAQIHNDYPLATEKLKINSDMLSKKDYVIHYRNLQLYISLGMKVTKVHKILKFKQSDWLKKFVDFNTEKRKNAINSFERNCFILMINSVFGKKLKI